jgi:CRISPR system Cascade subunit CasD
MQFLTFTLYSALAANGETGAIRHRHSWPRPARSAVLGLMAGALGITRDDDVAHAALASGYGYAVRTDAAGHSLRDWHTVQHPKGGKVFRTRRAELEFQDVGCILTTREYRTDALYTVALWERGGARWKLEELAAALRAPMYAPYLGRKCSALSVPMHPEIIEEETLPAALARRPPLPPDVAAWMPIALDDHPELACDEDAIGVTASRITSRRDGYHGRRLFSERVEHVTTITRTP